ncbi:MAG: metal-dependent hydrolase [Pelotomaculum sp. PtaB.Bin104]|nr:MAG: metal-dependent hydrolase [Pelotomaculum sp. PtaB.Bin104]
MANSIKWLGHAACQITTEKGAVILIDPWITGNPSCPVNKEDIKKADIILITHDHFDHLGEDVPDLVKATGATVIAQPEMVDTLQKLGVCADNIIFGMGMNIGGEVEVAGVKIIMTQAFHSSGTGSPTGYIIILEDGKSVYHAGDTGIFDSMRNFGELYELDLALIPIGSVFTMGPLQAAASLNLIRPKKAIPIHYQTFPILVQDPGEFIELAGKKAPEVQIEAIKPGQEITI